MIKCKKSKDIITISGHANFSEFGKDIVCASVSSIITTVVNCIFNLDKDAISYSDDGNIITITKLKSDKNINIILDTMIELLKDLESNYKQNIKVESEE